MSLLLPCKKYDRDSHGNSMSFHVPNRQQFFIEIDTKFHDYFMSVVQILFVFQAGTWPGFWTSSSHEIAMAFSKKMMGFLSDLVSFSNQIKLSVKKT